MGSLADFVAKSLWDLGIRKVFGLPGGENVHLVEALNKKGFEFHLVRNESSAAYAAAACYRLSGKPQACLTTLGPGITHAAAGLGHLWLDRAAVVVLTARTNENAGPLHTHQLLDLTALAGPMAKTSFVVQPKTAHQIPDVLSLMLDGRPGPVHLQMSNEAAAQPCVAFEPETKGLDIAAKQFVCSRRLTEATTLIGKMERPVIVAGLGVMGEEASKGIVSLAEALNAPVLVTPKAKGSISDLHVLSAGVIGLTRTDPGYGVLEAGDGVVAVGLDVVELVKPWDWQRPLVWISKWSNWDPEIPSTVDLIGDPSKLLYLLSERCEIRTEWNSVKVGPNREKRGNDGHVPVLTGRISPQQVLTALRQKAPVEALMSVDVGSHKIFFSLEWPTYQPDGFLLSNGLSCMGYGLASAIGVGTELPERTVLSIIGDGGMAMCAGELGLLREIDSNTKVILLKDSALDLIRSAQVRVGMLPIGTEYRAETDHVKLAEAFDIPGTHVSSFSELEDGLEEAFAIRGPYLIEVELDPSSYPTTPPALGEQA